MWLVCRGVAMWLQGRDAVGIAAVIAAVDIAKVTVLGGVAAVVAEARDPRVQGIVARAGSAPGAAREADAGGAGGAGSQAWDERDRAS